MNPYLSSRLRDFAYSDPLRNPSNRRRPCEPPDAEKNRIHEAAHAVAFWVHGVRVEELAAGAGFGRVLFPKSASPQSILLAATAGYSASRRIGGKDALSTEDARMVRQALDRLNLTDSPRLRAEREAAAERFLNGNWDSVRALAAELRRSSCLFYDDLHKLTLTHRVLRRFASLYPAYQPPCAGVHQLK
jgi:hypothetical protein